MSNFKIIYGIKNSINVLILTLKLTYNIFKYQYFITQKIII